MLIIMYIYKLIVVAICIMTRTSHLRKKRQHSIIIWQMKVRQSGKCQEVWLSLRGRNHKAVWWQRILSLRSTAPGRGNTPWACVGYLPKKGRDGGLHLITRTPDPNRVEMFGVSEGEAARRVLSQDWTKLSLRPKAAALEWSKIYACFSLTKNMIYVPHFT